MKAFRKMGKTRWLIGLLLILTIVVACGAVWASTGEGHGGGEGKVKDLIWRTMNFVVLIGALIILLRKPVAQGLESRRQGIKNQLADLEKQKQEAEKKRKEYEQKLSLLDKEVEKIVADYVRQGEELKAKIIADAKASAEKLQEQAKKGIEQEFQQAKEQLKAELAAQAVALAEELIRKQIKDDDQDRLVGEFLEKVVVAQ